MVWNYYQLGSLHSTDADLHTVRILIITVLTLGQWRIQDKILREAEFYGWLDLHL
jgi:hypothetical protein